MNSELSFNPSSIQASAKHGFYQSMVMRALEKMQLGCLRIHLPDGSLKTLGQPGANVSAEIRIASAEFFKRCVLFGDIGFGEAYVNGEWETADITAVISWFILNQENSPSLSGSRAKQTAINLLGAFNRLKHLLRPNSIATSRRNISDHYDLGNNFYQLWLDQTMTYSSALFTGPDQSLESAQHAKYDSLCRKLKIKPSDHVLEIGSGWGGFSCHAARHYGCRVTSITISKEQYDYARARVEFAGLSDRVDIQLQDYRLVEGKFDKVVSIEMMEALGDAYLETYFQKLHDVLKPDGVVGLQYITVPDRRHAELKRGVDWIQKHVFPGSLLLSISRVNQAINRTGDLFLHDLQDMGLSYARTLLQWRDNFNGRLEEIRSQGFDGRFIRKWNYYLSYCEAAFAMRHISVVQAVYTRPNNPRL